MRISISRASSKPTSTTRVALAICPAMLLAGLAAGCSDAGSAAAPDATAATLLDPPATIEVAEADDLSALARRITFSPCADDPELECGELAVPVDYADPHGPQIALTTVRAPALGRRKRGVVFVNPGGPGGSGVDLVVMEKPRFTALRDSFDIVSFDPRGVARSHAVDCVVDLAGLPAGDGLAGQAAQLDELGRRYARACRDQHGALVTQVGTDNVARDMDVFRAALGERELNYVGFSYGTVLGVAYATLFPQRVRAMVLDGNASPAWFTDYLVELDSDGSAGAELALRRLDQICSQAADCPLRTRGVVATFDRVVDRLDQNPVAVDGGVITGASFRANLLDALSEEVHGWPLIVQVLTAADAGDFAALPAVPVDAGPTATFVSGFAVLCDDSATRRPALDYLPTQLATQAIYPRFGGLNFGAVVTACSAWPAAYTAPVANLRTPHPVVVIGNDFDPATPLAWSRAMATALGGKATLVRYQGGGHTVYTAGNDCIDHAVESYVRDLAVPPHGLTCPATPLSFAPARRAARTATTTATEPAAVPRGFPRSPRLPGSR